MKLTDLRPKKSSKHSKKRVGRGQGTGLGKTCGKGHNGQNCRSGGGTRKGFEGGQMPLMRRLPKRGFSNFLFKKTYEVVNVCDIADRFKEKSDISIEDLYKSGLVRKGCKIKLLGNGEIKEAKNITVHAFSKQAKEKIEKAGGKINN